VKTLIESLGVYLPPRAVTTDEVLRGCRSEIRFPLEKFTGIHSRRMAGDTEFSIDLARHAVMDCLTRSRYRPEDVDLVIASSISRCDGADFRISLEPSTAVRLQKIFGFSRALAFDVSSACTGMFTAIWVADTFIKLGLARCALVVSGEYVTHLTRTAQRGIEGFMDPRLACLTLGDAGAAVMLEPTPDETMGLHGIDLFTLGRYSAYCIGKLAEAGPIMVTDSIRTTDIAVLPAAMSAFEVLERASASVRSVEHVIMHQTSRTTLRDVTRALQTSYPGFCEYANVVDNLTERGNTASTTHFVAVMDEIVSGRIRTGDNVVFGVSGSGQTVGAAVYTFDDLPDRVRRARATPGTTRSRPSLPQRGALATAKGSPVRIEAIGVVPPDAGLGSTLELCRVAAEDCLARSSRDRNDIGLIVHTGIYRTEGVSEPAIAALIAGALEINDAFEPPLARRTLAFDILNGGVGLLQACHVAVQAIRAGRVAAAMVVASEVESDAGIEIVSGRPPWAQLGSALILDDGHGTTGFGRFVFKSFPEHLEAVSVYATYEAGAAQLFFHHDPRLDDHYLARVPEVVRELLELEQVDRSRIKAIFPPQISTAFIARLAGVLDVDPARCIDATIPGRDLFTSSLPYALRDAARRDLVHAGDLGLIIAVGSGIQIGCALYAF